MIASGAAIGRVLSIVEAAMRKHRDFENLPSFQRYA
jgi:hypothetical protein